MAARVRYLILLVAVYALAVPSSLMAQEEATPTEATPTEATPTDATPTDATSTETTPTEAAPAPAPPAPQVLADERDEAPPPKPKAIAAASGSVTIADFSFSPGTITIDQGDTVTWTNNGPTAHSATADGGEFNTGILQAGQSSSHTFSQAGTYSYFCEPHPFMKGTIVVNAAQTGGGGGTGAGGTSGTTGSTGSTGTAAAQPAPSDGGPSLPNTGGSSGALLALGGLMLVLGVAVHRRTA